MKMRVLFLSIALAALAVCVGAAIEIRNVVISLKRELRAQSESRRQAETELATTRIALGDSERDLSRALARAKTAEFEKAAAKAEVAQQKLSLERLSQDLTTTRAELEDVRTSVVATTASLQERPSAMEELKAALKREREHNIALNRTVSRLQKYAPFENCAFYLPEDFRGEVTVVDPKWGFLMLSAGEKEGGFEKGKLLISRQGKLVAKVELQRVYDDYSIANVLPGWNLGDVMEGDSFIPPATQ
jgi:predicted RNase H-like nuclease (RuvC/YqgF family)